MAIPSSGQSLSLSALRTEFVGGSSAISLGDLYRGGSNIRKKAPNNQGTNLAASVATSGAIDVSDYYDQAKGFRFTFATGSITEADASTLFGNDYTVDYPKDILIPSGTTLGADDTAEYGLEVDSGGQGTITITNNGNIIGAGGAGGSAGSANGGTGGNGSAGGDAVKVAVPVTFVNNGSILAGGGGGSGGGGGGKGGNLQQQQQQQTTGQQGPFPASWSAGDWRFTNWSQYNWSKAFWNNALVAQGNYTATSLSSGQYTYYRGPPSGSFTTGVTQDGEGYAVGTQYVRPIYRQFPQQSQSQTQVAGHNGGAGGAGGLGRGFQNQPGGDSGASGSSGSTGQAGNGGAGGNGGTGGGYGQAGAAGQDGATGTSSTTSGSSGGNDGSVGAAGNYIEGFSLVTFTNNGTVAGGTE